MSGAEAKAAARKAALAARAVAHGQGLDAAAQEHLRAALAAHAGRVLAGYVPIRTEINALPVMSAWDAQVGVPVIEAKGQPLSFRRWTPAAAMAPGGFGTEIPAEAGEVVPEVLIVPLVAFDAAGYRLGYGGGFYDRTLARLRARGPVLALGFAYGAQELPEVPREITDERLDGVVTEAGLTRFA